MTQSKATTTPQPEKTAAPFATIEEALEEIRAGRMVVVCDDENRENEGDLTLAAQFATPEAINFMAKEGRGLICLSLTPERCEELGLELMAAKNESSFETPFTVSIEAREGVTTGISAHDRARTIQVAVDPETHPRDLVQPGHIFPLKSRSGGVLERTGQTEAAVDLARLAGLNPAGVICEVMNDDGTMARVGDLAGYCARHGLKMITIADLIAYRRRHDKLVERVAAARLPTAFGEFEVVGYRSLVDEKHHVALVKGEVEGRSDVLVRVHSECLTGDVFHSLRCDCGEQLESALAMIEAEGEGVLLYLAQEGRGIGLLNKLKAYRLQEDGLDTVEANLQLGLPADLRDYGIGAQILADLGLSSIRILTNNPKKIKGLEGYGLSVSAQVPIEHAPNPHNEEYMRTKAKRMGHTLHHQGLNLDAELLHSEREQDRAVAKDEQAQRKDTAVHDGFNERDGVEGHDGLEGRDGVEGRDGAGIFPGSGPDPGRRVCDCRRALLRGAGRAAGEWRARRVRAGRAGQGRSVRRARRVRAAARRLIRGAIRSLRWSGLSRRGDQGRDRPLRVRLRRDGSGGDAGPAGHGRAVRVRRAHVRDDGAGARARRRWQARSGTSRRRGGARDGRAARRARGRPQRPARTRPLNCRTRWPRYVTAAVRVRRSGRVAATRWSRPSGDSIRTCRRCGSSSGRRPGACMYAHAV